MPKIVGTRERVHKDFYESLTITDRGSVRSVLRAAKQEKPKECRNCGAPRQRVAWSCEYCGRVY